VNSIYLKSIKIKERKERSRRELLKVGKNKDRPIQKCKEIKLKSI
jgi:hypothetical protein